MMKWPFPKGTRVQISEYGTRKYTVGNTNPVGLIGKVVGVADSGRWVKVEWPNGHRNSYEENTLKAAALKLENK